MTEFVPYDPERPYLGRDAMHVYDAIDPEVAARFGKRVLAMVLSNTQYAKRYERFSHQWRMRPPPEYGPKHLGYLVVRRLGTPREYETWIHPDDFEESYRATST